MPTSGFVLYRTPTGQKPNSADIDALQKAIDSLCPVPAAGRRGSNIALAAGLVLMKQAPVADAHLAVPDAGMKDLWMVQVTGADRHYLLPKSLPQIVEADSRVRVMLEKRMGYKGSTSVMLRAANYYLGDRSSDVMARVLQLIPSPSSPPHGLALELVYLPTNDLATASKVLQELAEALIAALPPDSPGSLEVFQPSYQTYAAHLPSLYGPPHLAVAYTQLTLALVKGRTPG